MTLIDQKLRVAWHAFTLAKQAGKDDFDALSAAINPTLEAREAEIAALREGFALADKLVCDAIKRSGYYVGDGNLEKLAEIRTRLSPSIQGEGR